MHRENKQQSEKAREREREGGSVQKGEKAIESFSAGFFFPPLKAYSTQSESVWAKTDLMPKTISRPSCLCGTPAKKTVAFTTLTEAGVFSFGTAGMKYLTDSSHQ